MIDRHRTADPLLSVGPVRRAEFAIVAHAGGRLMAPDLVTRDERRAAAVELLASLLHWCDERELLLDELYDEACELFSEDCA